MKKIFLYEKLPYVLTILFALLALQINYLVSYYLDAPTLSYEYEIESQEVSKDTIFNQVKVKLQNVTTQKVFRNISISLRFQSDLVGYHRIYDPTIVPVAPAAIVPSRFVQQGNNKIIRYTINAIQPSNEYHLKFETAHYPLFQGFPKLYINASDDVVFLVEKNWEVWVTMHHFYINLFLLCLWLLLIFINLRFLSKYSVI